MLIKSELADHLQRQRDWSFDTFGPPPDGKPGDRNIAGTLDHLKKELTEVEQNPVDVEEWIDIVILAFDGALRMGWTPGEIAAALALKQHKNEMRQWPDWRTAAPGKAIEHVRGKTQAEYIRNAFAVATQGRKPPGLPHGENI